MNYSTINIDTVTDYLHNIRAAYQAILPPEPLTEFKEAPPPRLVAHGGAINLTINGVSKNYLSTNSLEALNANYGFGHSLFEIDFQLTSDNHLVAIHDWEASWKEFFEDVYDQASQINGAPQVVPTLKEFRKLQMHFGLHQMDPESLNVWLREHAGSYIITDIKARNLEGLRYLLNTDRRLVTERYIPQINHFSEYEEVRKMGFKRIILTLYKLNQEEDNDDKIGEFLRHSPVYAVTVHVDRIKKGKLLDRLKEVNAFVYVHPLTDKKLLSALQAKGVWGAYSYSLRPSQVERARE